MRRESFPIDRTSLLRDVYRNLILTGRSYAAFNEAEILPLVEHLRNHGEILDPMSGYGSLMLYCSTMGIRSYNIEINPPQYYWQVLNHPNNARILMASLDDHIADFIQGKDKIEIKKCADVSDEWFTHDARLVLYALHEKIHKAVSMHEKKQSHAEELSLALVLPFVGRLSCIVPGNNPTRLKKGGLCIYADWPQDYVTYLSAVRARLERLVATRKKAAHVIRMGDCRKLALPIRRFSAMITSPPYPNRVDYAIMFAPENDFLVWLMKANLIKRKYSQGFIIGTNVVTGRGRQSVRSTVAKKFLSTLEAYKGTIKAERANRSYYLPYYANYFADLENAYFNIVPGLREKFEGYIVVVDNTVRTSFIPVAESILETWRYLGFKAAIHSKKEDFHVGTQNPRARGFKAKHTEYTIRVWR